jgi:hypothetical protein
MRLQDIRYLNQLVGTPYVWWKEGESTVHTLAPFYAKASPVPRIDEIKRLGTNCAGLINLLCRKVGTPIPGVSEGDYYAGGTPSWYESLKARGKLHPIDDQVYPIGTLLLAEYSNPEWQGHLAIVSTPGTLHTLKICHSFPEHGVVIDEPVSLTHGLVETGYYTSTAKSEDWLYQVE